MSELPCRKIIRETVRLNPHRGMTQAHVAHAPDHIEFEVYARADFAADQFQKVLMPIIQSSSVSCGMGTFKLLFAGEFAFSMGSVWLHNLVLQQPNVLRAEMQPIKNRVTSITIPPDNRKYLYKHEDMELFCDACGRELKISELESDSHDEGGYSDKVCPHCESWECVEWEDEVLPDDELAVIAQSNLGPEGSEGN